jgi:hypothetical protein
MFRYLFVALYLYSTHREYGVDCSILFKRVLNFSDPGKLRTFSWGQTSPLNSTMGHNNGSS